MLLKNPAKELYEILKKASELSPESEAIGVLITSIGGISKNANLETIVMDGWVKIFGLIYNCREILQELNEDELVISIYTQAVNTIGNDVARWMERTLEKQHKNSLVTWANIPYLNDSKYLPLITIGRLGLDLDKNNVTLSDDKLSNICSTIKNAIDGLKNISEEEIDLNTRDEVIRKLESLLETIKNKRINNSDEIKGGVATIICDLLQKAKQSNTMAIIKVVLYIAEFT
jgi:hypothetical protein